MAYRPCGGTGASLALPTTLWEQSCAQLSAKACTSLGPSRQAAALPESRAVLSYLAAKGCTSLGPSRQAAALPESRAVLSCLPKHVPPWAPPDRRLYSLRAVLCSAIDICQSMYLPGLSSHSPRAICQRVSCFQEVGSCPSCWLLSALRLVLETVVILVVHL